jgi:hypothetical protein
MSRIDEGKSEIVSGLGREARKMIYLWLFMRALFNF